jgi:hypothetical protein
MQGEYYMPLRISVRRACVGKKVARSDGGVLHAGIGLV